jgi:hypothetical protein
MSYSRNPEPEHVKPRSAIKICQYCIFTGKKDIFHIINMGGKVRYEAIKKRQKSYRYDDGNVAGTERENVRDVKLMSYSK